MWVLFFVEYTGPTNIVEKIPETIIVVMKHFPCRNKYKLMINKRKRKYCEKHYGHKTYKDYILNWFLTCAN